MGGKFDKRIGPTVETLLGQQKWHHERRKLRKVALDCQLFERVKWGKLCYTFDNGNVAMIYGLKDFCALGFLKGSLLQDPYGLLIKPGENSQAARWIKFGGLQEIEEMEGILKSYIHQAIEVEKLGLRVEFKEKRELVFPGELKAAFENSPAFKVAFDGLTPGRQRGYNLYFTAAKQSKTRQSRIEKSRQRILEGKGLQDR